MVSLVEDGDLHGVELHDALLHEVFESARAGDDNVHTATHRVFLRALRDATEDGHDAEAGAGCEGLDNAGDLRRKFADRCEHEA